MSQSWNAPNINNPILLDVPAQKAINDALAKMDFQGFVDIPADSKRITSNESTGEVTFEVLKNNSWQKITSIDISSKQVGGFTPSKTAQANHVVVRNALGQIEGDITGNANSASTAQALSEVNSIAMGGTGENTVDGARRAFGITELSEAFTEAQQQSNQTFLAIQEQIELTNNNVTTAQTTADEAVTVLEDSQSRGQTTQHPRALGSSNARVSLGSAEAKVTGSYWISPVEDAHNAFGSPSAHFLEVNNIDNVVVEQVATSSTGIKKNRVFGYAESSIAPWNISTSEELAYAFEHGQIGDTVSQLQDNVDIDTLTTSGEFYTYTGVNAPKTSGWFITVRQNSGGVLIQTVTLSGAAESTTVPVRYMRRRNSAGVWTDWVESSPISEDYIIDYYPKTDEEKASAGDSWWRKWKSGFIEQGGYATRTASTQYVNLNIPMKTTNYTPTVIIHYAATSQGYPVHVPERSTTRMQVYCTSNWYGYYWCVSGY